MNFTHLICHRFLFEREILREKDLFLCREGVNVFIHADNGLEIPPVESLSLYELRSPGLDNTWYVRIDDTMEFEAFVRRMESIIFREEEGVLTVDDPVYGKVRYGLMNRSVNI